MNSAKNKKQKTQTDLQAFTPIEIYFVFLSDNSDGIYKISEYERIPIFFLKDTIELEKIDW